MSTNCRSEHGDVSSDDEQEIMRRNWNKNISTIKKVVYINRNHFLSNYLPTNLISQTAFREGATSTDIESDVMFQMGFDNGYKDGFKDGYTNGSYKSTMM